MMRRNRVLVVDDNSVNRDIIEEILGDDYDIIMAANGPDAVMLAERYHPQLVLLDVMLPGVNGYEICRRMRGMPGMTDVKIIMVTAKAMPSERAQGFEAGADAYLTKPFDDADLMAAIRSTGVHPKVRVAVSGNGHVRKAGAVRS